MRRISTDKAFIGNLDYKLMKGESWAMVEESLVYDGGLILSGSHHPRNDGLPWI